MRTACLSACLPCLLPPPLGADGHCASRATGGRARSCHSFHRFLKVRLRPPSPVDLAPYLDPTSDAAREACERSALESQPPTFDLNTTSAVVSVSSAAELPTLLYILSSIDGARKFKLCAVRG
ncbi:hypothetical protein T492DRAFT_422498 [Pavlovales sp. CCMP2436]|nr:hypothetical protein T492DRAFT_422498 [Pavlovales sp. CCMP2436]